MVKLQNLNKAKCDNGFTLVELAIVLVIFGLMTSILVLAFGRYMGERIQTRTFEAMRQSTSAVAVVQQFDGAYPCPADPAIGPEHEDYGLPLCDPADRNRLIVVQGRDIDGDGIGETVLIGAMPYKAIIDPDNNPMTNDGFSDDYKQWHSMDGWNSKLTYAVTETLTNSGTFNHDNGAIFIVDENNVPLLRVPGSAHYAIISHGENAEGAFSENGSQIGDCVDIVQPAEVEAASTKIPKDERENCDHELAIGGGPHIASITDAVFLSALRNENPNDYYDDYVNFSLGTVSSLWENVFPVISDNGTPGDINDDFPIERIINMNGGNFGIGTNTPSEQLHIIGDLQAFKIQSDAVCDSTGADCMPAEIIAGEVADMTCPDGEIVTRIELNRVTCENPFGPSAFQPCPAGQFLTGLSSLNGPICTTP